MTAKKNPIPDVAAMRAAIAPVIDAVSRLDAVDRILVCGELNEALLEGQASLARVRRASVRELRASGMTLKEIGAEVGLAPQRIHQMEIGMGRKEKQGR